jgi:nucleotide-binding universal stress UspA family protein
MTRIVVGVDGSSASKKALEWAVAEAKLRDAEIDAVHSWVFPTLAEAYGLSAAIDSDLFAEVEQAARELVDREIAALGETGVPIRAHVTEGPAAQILLGAAADADLLVVGSRGRGGFSGLLLGSVSQQCAHHAPCPIVIVRAAPDTPTG